MPFMSMLVVSTAVSLIVHIIRRIR